MNIGFDYDDTFTRDPEGWTEAIAILRKRGHNVLLVTWRSQDELNPLLISLFGVFDGYFATNRQAKEKFMYDQGIRIDVVIDDNPRSWLQDMEKCTW